MRSYPQHPQICVGAVIVKEHRILLVRRAQPPNLGLWSVPGGSVKLGENLHAAVAREVREETGINCEVGHLIYHSEIIEKDTTGAHRFHYVILDFMAYYQSGQATPQSDTDAAQWVPVDQLQQYALAAGMDQLIQVAQPYLLPMTHSH